MRVLLKYIMMTFFVIKVGDVISQNEVVIEKVAKKGYGGYVWHSSCIIFYNSKIITVVLGNTNTIYGSNQDVQVLEFDKATLDLTLKEKLKGEYRSIADVRIAILKEDAAYSGFFSFEEDRWGDAAGIFDVSVVDSNNSRGEKVVLEYKYQHLANSYYSDAGGYGTTNTVHMYEQNDFTISIPGKWTTKIERKFRAENGCYAPKMVVSNDNLYVFYYSGAATLFESSKFCCSKISWEDGSITEMKVKYPDNFNAAFRNIYIIPLADGSFAILSYKKPPGLTLYKLTIK